MQSSFLVRPLDDLLGSVGNVRLLRYLCTEAAGPVSAPQAAKRVGLTEAATRRSLKRLADTGFVVRRGGGRGGYWELRSDDVMIAAVCDAFAQERYRFERFVEQLRESLREMPEIASAWLSDAPEHTERSLALSLVVDAVARPWIGQEVGRRMASLEQGYDVVIEPAVHTEADLPEPDPDEVVSLVGALPGAAAGSYWRSGTGVPATHEAREQRSLRAAATIADMVRRDPSLVERAKHHVDLRLREGAGTATDDLLEWRRILESYSLPRLTGFLTSDTSRARRLRQSSPFFAVLSADERDRLIAGLEREDGS